MAHRLSQRDVTVPSFEYRLHPPTMWLRRAAAVGLVNSATSAVSSATATASATPHTKGSWSQLIASTSADIHLLMLENIAITATSAADSGILLDVGVGGAGSETVVIPNIPFGYRVGSERVEIPVMIPAGSRIALRSQASQASKAMNVYARGFQMPHGLRPAPYVTNYGANTAASKGVSLGAAGATNTKTSWVEITSATTERLAAVHVGIQGDSQTNMASAFFLLDIGIGGAGSETVVIADIGGFMFNTESYQWLATPTLFPLDLPRGTRISARYQTASTSNQIDVSILGVPWRI